MNPCNPSKEQPQCKACKRFTRENPEPSAHRISENGNSYHRPSWARKGPLIDATVLKWPGGVCPMRT